MGKRYLGTVALLMTAACETAAATMFSAEITDQDGKPVMNAVVTLVPDPQGGMPGASTRLAIERLIDQRRETFLPLVTIIPRNGRVIFANSDPTTHQVYSFSPVKQFEITLASGTSSPPITFDKPGVAALGCNIHDNMIAYVFVAESPWTALTGSDGRAVIEDVPPGNYQARVWHYRYPPRRELPSARIAVSTDTTQWAANIRVLTQSGTRSHAGSY
jgi:plastocyanin